MTLFGNWWFRKEKPLPGLIGLGGGATSLTLGGAAPFTATGANAPDCPADGLDPAPTSPTGEMYFTFTGPGTFSIGQTMTGWKVLAIAGGGGGGGPSQSGGGGAGNMWRTVQPYTLDKGDYTITIGSGGGMNNNGGDTVIAGPAPGPYVGPTNAWTGGIQLTLDGGGHGGGPMNSPIPKTGEAGGSGGGGAHPGGGGGPSTQPGAGRGYPGYTSHEGKGGGGGGAQGGGPGNSNSGGSAYDHPGQQWAGPAIGVPAIPTGPNQWAPGGGGFNEQWPHNGGGNAGAEFRGGGGQGRKNSPAQGPGAGGGGIVIFSFPKANL